MVYSALSCDCSCMHVNSRPAHSPAVGEVMRSAVSAESQLCEWPQYHAHLQPGVARSGQAYRDYVVPVCPRCGNSSSQRTTAPPRVAALAPLHHPNFIAASLRHCAIVCAATASPGDCLSNIRC